MNHFTNKRKYICVEYICTVQTVLIKWSISVMVHNYHF